MREIVKLGFVLALVLAVNDALGQAWQPQPKQTTVVSWQSAELQHNLGEVARQYKVKAAATPVPKVVVRWKLDENGVIHKEWVITPVFPGPDQLFLLTKGRSK